MMFIRHGCCHAVGIAAVFLASALVGSYAAACHFTEHSLRQGNIVSEQNTSKLKDELSILFVLDPNCYLCYEEVGIDAFTNDTLLRWVHGLKDALTATPMNPEGDALQVVVEDAISHGQFEFKKQGDDASVTYQEYLEAAWRSGAGSVRLPTNLILMRQLAMVGARPDTVLRDAEVPDEHEPPKGSCSAWKDHWMLKRVSNLVEGMLERVTGKENAPEGPLDQGDNPEEQGETHASCNLPLDRIKVTTVDNFWTTVAAADRHGVLLSCKSGIPGAGDLEMLQITTDLHNTVVVLPRVVPQVYGMGGRFRGVSGAIDSLATFLNIAGMTSVPSLEEYAVLPNKVVLTNMYEAYFKEDPTTRHPPIPTARVPAPGSREALNHLNYLKRSGTQQIEVGRLDHIMHGIWVAMRSLELSLVDSNRDDDALRKITVTNRESVHGGSDEEEMIHFVIKREYSEGSLHVRSFAFPRAALCLDDLPSTVDFRGDKPWRARPALPSQSSSPNEEAVPSCNSANGAAPPCGIEQAVLTVPYLRDPATFAAEQSCGEGFLIQPKIVEMPLSEYSSQSGCNDLLLPPSPEYMRASFEGTTPVFDCLVYLIGGASAVGSENDTLVVYTPSELGLVHGWGILEMKNYTLPHGSYLSNLDIPLPSARSQGQSQDIDEYSAGERALQNSVGDEAHLGRRPTPWPEMHRSIVETALDGAKAIAKYGGSKMRTIGNLFARIDVVMAAPVARQGGGMANDPSPAMFVPMINEMDWFNSAGMMIAAWKTPYPVPSLPPGKDALEASGMSSSWGYRIAQKLLDEVAAAHANRIARSSRLDLQAAS